MLNYFKNSFKRKIARRVTKEYPPIVREYNLEKDGKIEFAHWSNPLAKPYGLDQSMVDFYRQYINDGDLVIDIGANTGDTTVPMALAAGKSGTTLGFEPSPFVFKILEKNATLNKDRTNIVPLPYAISNEEDEFYFISSEASFGNGGISKTKESRHGKFIHKEKIKGVNLWDYVKQNYPEKRVAFIKVDVEGYDKEILKSIPELIREHKPTIIAESFVHSSDEEKMELWHVINDLGYNMYYFEDFVTGTERKDLTKPEDLLPWKTVINVCATPK